MACINADGTLTESAKALLAITGEEAWTPEELSRLLGVPLYMIRSNLREMSTAGLLQEEGGRYRTTALGRERLAGN